MAALAAAYAEVVDYEEFVERQQEYLELPGQPASFDAGSSMLDPGFL